MRFLFACGGTAGHINPALAIAGKLRKLMPDAEFLFVGSGREMENRLIPAENFKIENITINGFERSFSLYGLKRNAMMLKNLVVSARQSKELITRFKPDAVIGTGGYVCYPVLKTAGKMGIPTFMHESNAIPGLTTKMLSGLVNKVMVAFPNMESYYKKPDRVIMTGTPVRGDFGAMTKKQAREALGINNDKPLVVSFWGSLGASVMNDYMADFIKLNNSELSFNHIHATGGGDAGLEKMKGRLSDRNVSEVSDIIDIRPYISNMGTVMTASDIVLCRAGASTIAELTLMGKPSVLVPSPNVTNNHQEKNARAVEKEGGAKVITESECNGEMLYRTVKEMLNDKEGMSKMEKAAYDLAVKDSCEKIVDIIMSYIN